MSFQRLVGNKIRLGFTFLTSSHFTLPTLLSYWRTVSQQGLRQGSVCDDVKIVKPNRTWRFWNNRFWHNFSFVFMTWSFSLLRKNSIDFFLQFSSIYLSISKLLQFSSIFSNLLLALNFFLQFSLFFSLPTLA